MSERKPGRPLSPIKGEELTLSLPQGILDALRELLGKHVYASKTVNELAEALIAETLQRRRADQTIGPDSRLKTYRLRDEPLVKDQAGDDRET
jgi:hypothetical protein